MYWCIQLTKSSIKSILSLQKTFTPTHLLFMKSLLHVALLCSFFTPSLAQVDSTYRFYPTTKSFVKNEFRYYPFMEKKDSSDIFMELRNPLFSESYQGNTYIDKCWAMKVDTSVFINLKYREDNKRVGCFAKTTVSGRYNIVVIGPGAPKKLLYTQVNAGTIRALFTPEDICSTKLMRKYCWKTTDNFSRSILIADALNIPPGVDSNVPLSLLSKKHLEVIMRGDKALREKYKDKNIKVEDVIDIITQLNNKYQHYFNK